MLIAEPLGETFRLAKGVEHPRQLPEQQIGAVEFSVKVDGQADRVGAFGEVLERTEGLREAGHGRAGGAARAGTGPGAPEELDGSLPHLAFPEMSPQGQQVRLQIAGVERFQRLPGPAVAQLALRGSN